jgi:hypothetical protein
MIIPKNREIIIILQEFHRHNGNMSNKQNIQFSKQFK